MFLGYFNPSYQICWIFFTKCSTTGHYYLIVGHTNILTCDYLYSVLVFWIFFRSPLYSSVDQVTIAIRLIFGNFGLQLLIFSHQKTSLGRMAVLPFDHSDEIECQARMEKYYLVSYPYSFHFPSLWCFRILSRQEFQEVGQRWNSQSLTSISAQETNNCTQENWHSSSTLSHATTRSFCSDVFTNLEFPLMHQIDELSWMSEFIIDELRFLCRFFYF